MLHLQVGQEDYSGVVGPYPNFDQLYDQYQDGKFGEQGQDAWTAMLERWSSRSGIALRAGATALTGVYFEYAQQG